MTQEKIPTRPEYQARYEVQVSATPGGGWQTVEGFGDLDAAHQAAALRLHDEGVPGVRIIEVLAFEVNPLFIT
jgi:hypothetical protein